jgi:hypothetical protein
VGEQVGVGVEVVEEVVLVVVLVLLVLAHARDVVKPDAQQVTVIARNRDRNSGAQVLIPCNASATKGGGNRASSVERRVGEDRLCRSAAVGAGCLVDARAKPALPLGRRLYQSPGLDCDASHSTRLASTRHAATMG